MTKEDIEVIHSPDKESSDSYQFETRRFLPTDLDSVVRINRATLPENYPRHFFLSVHSSCPEAFRVATIKDHLIGYSMCRIEHGTSIFSRFKLVRKGHIISVAVLRNFQRMGVGSSLLSEVIDAIKQKGASESFLEVRETNISAIKLYEKFDYVTIKSLRKYYRDGEDALLLGRKLK